VKKHRLVNKKMQNKFFNFNHKKNMKKTCTKTQAFNCESATTCNKSEFTIGGGVYVNSVEVKSV